MTSLNLADNAIGGHRDAMGRFNATPEGTGYHDFILLHICHTSLFLSLSLMTSGPAAIADAIKNMGALSSANLLRNSIPVEQAQELVKIMRAKKNLTTLCGLSGEETELDFSGQHLGAGDAVLIANDISDMGALITVIMHKYPLPIEDIKTKAELDLSGKGLVFLDAILLAALLPLNVSRRMCRYLCCHLSLISLCRQGGYDQAHVW
jgi:hypothetical protein